MCIFIFFNVHRNGLEELVGQEIVIDFVCLRFLLQLQVVLFPFLCVLFSTGTFANLEGNALLRALAEQRIFELRKVSTSCIFVLLTNYSI